MINLSDVAKAHGTEPLFRDVSMQLLPGRRIALVGRNGSGKTTLLEIVIGMQDADSGTVSRDRGTRIGYLPQDVGEASTGTVLETVLEGAVEVMAIERRMRELEERITAADGDESERLLGLYAHEQDRYTNLGGYGIEADAHRILSGLGFTTTDAERPVTELSGGWRVRAALARLLLADPDVLVLDEPTNHLDVETISWLEGVLAQRAGAVLFTSHDRDFIDNVADRVAELAFGTVTEYVGGFADFVAQREMRLVQMQAAARNQQRQIEQTERFIEQFRYKASKAKQVQSRVKSLDRVERIEVAEEDSPRVRFAFPEPQRSGRVVAELQGVSKSFGDLRVLDRVDLVLERGWKVAVVGPNGSGKSTLLRLLTGELTPDAGEVSIGHNVQPATFVQHQVVVGGQVPGNGAAGNGAPHGGAVLRAERSVLDEFTAALDDRHRGRNPRSMLGAFGFGEELAEQQVGALSGGEQTRLALARLMVSPVNLLCLDEPTNHLDIASRGILEDALVAFPGTVLLITHDRAVLRSVADHVLELSDGHARWFPGTYEEYLGRRDRSTAGRGSSAAAGDRTPTIGTTLQDRGDRAAAKRAEAERRNALSAATRDLRREVERVERELERTEAEVAELTRELADPAAYDDKDRVKALVVRHGDAKDRAAELMTRWERAQHELERAESQATADFS